MTASTFGLGRLQQRLLVGVLELRECFAAEMFLTMRIDPFDAHAQDVPDRQAALVTELRRRFDERALHIPNVAGGIRRLHMTIDELRYAGLSGARADIVDGDQSIAGRQNECPFGGIEKGRMVLAGGTGRFIGFFGATGNANRGNRHEGEALE